MKSINFAIVFIFIGIHVSAQHNMDDSLKIWRAKSREFERSVDSFRILATGLNDDQVLLDQRKQVVNDSINRMAGRDIARNIHNDPRIDSLSQKLVSLNQTGIFLNERFDFRLVQIDSCMGGQREMDRKIYNSEHKKTAQNK